jgi:hypothetical protein
VSSEQEASVQGWVSFAEGFHLWDRKEHVGSYEPEKCISGALPKRIDRLARRRLEGKFVRITGKFSPANRESLQIGEQIVRYFKGTRFENSCGGGRVFLGSQVTPAEEVGSDPQGSKG